MKLEKKEDENGFNDVSWEPSFGNGTKGELKPLGKGSKP